MANVIDRGRVRMGVQGRGVARIMKGIQFMVDFVFIGIGLEVKMRSRIGMGVVRGRRRRSIHLLGSGSGHRIDLLGRRKI